MNDNKRRISSFIESLEGETTVESSIILGGKKSSSEKPTGVANGGDCINTVLENCKSSSNGGDCKNSLSNCDDSVNGGDCINGWNPGKD